MNESLPPWILPIKLERSSERLTSLGGRVMLEESARLACAALRGRGKENVR